MLESPATDLGRAAEETMLAQEALALRDELMAYAAQLIRMSTQAGLGGQDLSVRVKEPEHLAHLITRAASAIQARKWAPAEAEAAQLRARLHEAEKGAEAMRNKAAEIVGRRAAQARAKLNGPYRDVADELALATCSVLERGIRALTPAPEANQEAGDGR